MALTRKNIRFSGSHSDKKRKATVLCLACFFYLVQGWPFAAYSQEPMDLQASNIPENARVRITSSPTGCQITLDGKRVDSPTPADLELNPGNLFVIVNEEGYQPLSHEMVVVNGEQVELHFIMLRTPPEPPTAEELRALSPPFGVDDPNSDYWADAKPREMANESCRDCHSPILTLHSVGEHRNLYCQDCHSALSDHVKDDKVIGQMDVVRGDGIQTLCMTCHDRENRNRTREPARTVVVSQHLQQLRVTPVNKCQECHHVHDPQKWVHEAREMVGLPEIMASIPLLNEKSAIEKRNKYNSLAEFFTVFPLATGVLAMAVSENSGSFPAEILAVSGVILVAGSYLLGQRAFNKELENIWALNDERRAVNVRVKEHNLLVKKAMVDHERAIEAWAIASEGRGVVEIKRQ